VSVNVSADRMMSAGFADTVKPVAVSVRTRIPGQSLAAPEWRRRRTREHLLLDDGPHQARGLNTDPLAHDILAFVPTPINARLRNFAAHLIAADIALVTYISEVLGGELVVSNRSSLWTHKQGRWQLRFHQGTPRLDD
jgi:hypothetical protein